MKKIPLRGKRGQGKYTLVDDTDFERLKHAKLHVDRDGYVRTADSIRLHRQILLTPRGVPVDHKNRNKLDNQSGNLRVCTRRDNARNRTVVNSTGYRGVREYNHNVFYATFRGKLLGKFPTKEAAALAWNDAARKEYGEFAVLNEVTS